MPRVQKGAKSGESGLPLQKNAICHSGSLWYNKKRGVFMANKVQAGLRMLSVVLLFLCMAVIYWFSDQQSAASSAISGGMTEDVIAFLFPQFSDWPLKLQADVYFFIEVCLRKAAHFLIFALLGGLWLFAADCFFKTKWWIKLAVSFAGSVFYAAFDEFHQTLVPGRSGEFRDVCIDAAGALLGIFAIWLFMKITTSLMRRKALKKKKKKV